MRSSSPSNQKTSILDENIFRSIKKKFQHMRYTTHFSLVFLWQTVQKPQLVF